MRGVARDVGVSLASIQHHYPTKQDLWQACIGRVTTTGIETTSDGQQRPIAELFQVMIERNAAAPGLFAAVLGDRSPGHEERLAYVASRVAERVEDGRNLVGGATELGLLREVDADAVLALIVLGIGSLGSSKAAAEHLFGFDLDDTDDRQRLANALTDIVLFGIVTRDGGQAAQVAGGSAA